MGIELSQADREQLAADAIDHFIGLGLIENKLRETGLPASQRNDEATLVYSNVSSKAILKRFVAFTE